MWPNFFYTLNISAKNFSPPKRAQVHGPMEMSIGAFSPKSGSGYGWI